MTKELKNIIEKAGVMFAKYGIRSVTMDDISKELRISKKTLYKHVKDKSDLVTQVFDFSIHEAIRTFKEIGESEMNAMEKMIEIAKLTRCEIRDFKQSMEYDLRKYYPEIYGRVREIRRHFALELHTEGLKKGIEQGYFRSDLKPEIIGKLFYLKLEAIIQHTDIFTPEEYASHDVFFEDFIYHIRGIASERGIKILEEKLHELDLKK